MFESLCMYRLFYCREPWWVTRPRHYLCSHQRLLVPGTNGNEHRLSLKCSDRRPIVTLVRPRWAQVSNVHTDSNTKLLKHLRRSAEWVLADDAGASLGDLLVLRICCAGTDKAYVVIFSSYDRCYVRTAGYGQHQQLPLDADPVISSLLST